jgi:8-oxo-dGTP pyrophosphatase MutT (NUDIX family)
MASACIYIECPVTKRILGVSRKDDPNAFGLPGGKVEPGETELRGAVRELREETGIVLEWCWHQDFTLPEIFRREGSITFRVETSQIVNLEGRRPSELGRVAWVTPEQLLAGPFGDYNRGMLEHIGRIPRRMPTKHAQDLLRKVMATRYAAGMLVERNHERADKVYKDAQDAYAAMNAYVVELELRAGEIDS